MAKKLKELKLNLRPFFNKEGKILRAKYKSLLTEKRGRRMDSAPPNAPETIATKGKNHWLVDTGETRDKGIKFRAGSRSLIVFGSGNKHSGKRTYFGVPGGHIGRKKGVRRPRTEKRTLVAKKPPTYRQIFKYHNAEGYSGIFNKLPVNSKLPEKLDKELKRQLIPQLSKAFTKKFRFKI